MKKTLVQRVRVVSRLLLPWAVLGVCAVLVVTFIQTELLVRVSTVASTQGAATVQSEVTTSLAMSTVWEEVQEQIAGVWSRTAQTAQLIFSIDSLPSVTRLPLTQSTVVSPEAITSGGAPLGVDTESLQINVPLFLTDELVVTGLTQLDDATLRGILTVNDATNLNNLTVSGGAQLNELSVTNSITTSELTAQSVDVATLVGEQATFGLLQVSGETELGELVTASGGLQTNGADIDAGTGNVFAANIVNEVIAGTNITITGTRNAPVIAFDTDNLEMVESLNGEQGELTLTGGTGIRISGLQINSEDTLSLVRSRGGCTGCITDNDVAQNLTISGGVINNTVIGSTTRAAGFFSELTIGSSSATTSRFTVQGTATSTFGGTVNLESGCFAIDGVCIDGSDISYTGLLDTPNVLLAQSVPFVNLDGDGLTQSASLLFDGNQLTVGSATTSTTLTVGGAAVVGDVLTVSGTATSTFGGSIDITSGCLAIAGECIAIGIDSYVDLLDTPDTLIAGALQFASSSATTLTQSSNLVFDGTRLGVGTDSPLTELSVAGTASVLGAGAVRFYDADNSHFVGLRASSSVASSFVWTLPLADGTNNQLLVTDGNGQLRFDDISALGGGATTYLDLTDTPNSFVNYSIPFVNATGTELTQASNLVYRNNFLGVGLNNPTRRLTVLGDVQFQSSASQVGMLFDTALNRFGFGTANPTDFMTVQGGSITQRGGVGGNRYTPRSIANIPLISQANDVVVVGDYAYVVTNQNGNDFHVIDISNPQAPTEVESIPLPAGATSLAISGRYAYVTTEVTGDDFHVIDISNPLDVVEVASVPLPSTANTVALQGQYAYVGTDNPGTDFHVIDISNPLAPFEVMAAALNMDDTVNDIVVAGQFAYVVTSSVDFDFHIVDISNPLVPVEVGQLLLPTTASAVAVVGRYAYVTTGVDGNDFHIIDISNPLTPVEVGSLPLDAGATGVFVAGRYAYVTSLDIGNDLHVIDVANPSTPILIGELDLAAGSVQAITVVGRYAYLTSGTTGDEFHVVDISGAELQSANIYTLEAGVLNVSAGAQVAGRVVAGLGVRAGVEGVQTDGILSVLSAQSSYIAGNLGIGTTTPNSKLTVDGTIQASNLFGGATGLETDANGNIIRVVSDERLKKNIVTIDGALDDVLQLRGVRYEWIDTERFGAQVEVGFLAQEVDGVVPEVVRKGGEYWSLNTRNLVAVVVEAIKELWHIVQGNQTEIANLRERVDDLERQLEGSTTATVVTSSSSPEPQLTADDVDTATEATSSLPESDVAYEDDNLETEVVATSSTEEIRAEQLDTTVDMANSTTSTVMPEQEPEADEMSFATTESPTAPSTNIESSENTASSSTSTPGIMQ